MRVDWILRLYPPAWRKRYQEEMQAVLEQHTITLATVFDLLIGAADARLNPAYRTKEGIMFQRFPDTRSLAIAFLYMLATSQFFTSIWMTMHHSLGFAGNSIEGLTAFLAVICYIAVSVVALIPLFGIAGSLIKDALKNRRGGTLIFALLSLVLIVAMSLWYAWHITNGQFGSPSDFMGGLLMCVIILSPITSLFVAGMKGAALLRKRAWGPVLLALVIGVGLPVSNILFDAWNYGEVIRVSPDFMPLYISYVLMPFIPLSALLLTLTNDEMSLRHRPVMLVFGTLLGLVLAVNLTAIFIWDVDRWMGGAWIFLPDFGPWPFFGGQWIGVFFVHMIIQGITIGAALLALVYAFILFGRRDKTARPLPE